MKQFMRFDLADRDQAQALINLVAALSQTGIYYKVENNGLESVLIIGG